MQSHNQNSQERIIPFEYYNKKITFKKENGTIMVNATEMAKPFGKLPKNWLRLDSTKNFLQVLENQRGSDLSIADNQLVRIIKGGLNPGTWLQEDVAMEFARWLSPEFAIWCNDRIKELMNYGFTTINPDEILNPDVMIKYAKMLKEERQENEKLKTENNELRPKAEKFEQVVSSKGLISMKGVADSLGYGRNTFMQMLRDYDILTGRLPYRRFIDAGYFEVKMRSKNGELYPTAFATAKGFEYLSKKFGDNQLRISI